MLFERLIGDDRALDAFLADVCTRDWHFQHDAGRDFADTSAELIAAHPQHAAAIRRWGSHFIDSVGPVLPGMAAIVDELDANGVPLFAITNFSHEFWPPFRAREGWMFDRFRDVVVSGVEKMVKPDPAIFTLALDRFGLTPGEAVFVDDNAANVAAAAAMGIVALPFTDAARLRGELTGLGLLG